MKKHIILGLALMSLSLIPNAAAFANQSPQLLVNSATSTPSQLIIDPAPKQECLLIQSNIAFGSRGQIVSALQKLLSDNGFFSVSQTGYFGPITLQSVKNFQAKYGVPATGFVGPLTRGKIVTELCKLEPITPPISNSSLNIISPKTGDTLMRGDTEKITWTDSNVYIQAQKYDITLAPYMNCGVGKPCTMMAIKPYTIATGTLSTSDGYTWTVGSTLETDRTIPDGQYSINVCTTGSVGSNCAQSGVFALTSGTAVITPIPEPIATSTFTQLSPNAGPIGTKVRMTTTHFNEIDHINFGGGYIPKSAISASNGYVEFNVPSSLAPACFYATPIHCMIASVMTAPNTYWISMVLTNGNKSNQMPFTVTAGTQ